jgi:hypothetical protein
MSDYLDDDGYPTEEAISLIEKWPYNDPQGLFDFIEEMWAIVDFNERTIEHVSLSTAGWSGNEGIIEAMKENWQFWMLYWYSSTRGGHYEFDLSRKYGE